METTTRIIIADDQRLFADGLRYIIESKAADFEVVDIAENGQQAIFKVREHKPDIVLMDVRMPVMDGMEATRIIHEKYPDIKILILTTFDDDEYIQRSLQNGAIGYLLKNRPPDEFIDSIRALRRGIVQLDPAVSSKFLVMPRKSGKLEKEFSQALHTLTPREREVMRMLVEAHGVRQIAAALGMAVQTARNHITNIYLKLGIHNRIEIVRHIDQLRDFIDNEM